MKLSTIGTDQIAVRDARAALTRGEAQYYAGQIGWAQVLLLRTAVADAEAAVDADCSAYDVNPEAEV